MNKVSCELEYRTYIPYAVIAVPFCHVEFSGKDWYDYLRKWDGSVPQVQGSSTPIVNIG